MLLFYQSVAKLDKNCDNLFKVMVWKGKYHTLVY
jgi:hypothetical protein